LAEKGITLNKLEPAVIDAGEHKIVCLTGHLGDRLEEMNLQPRDQVVMVRVDEDTLAQLDAWVETAALFIREGLRLRGAELDDLRHAIESVREAKARLREAADRVLGVSESGQDVGE